MFHSCRWRGRWYCCRRETDVSTGRTYSRCTCTVSNITLYNNCLVFLFFLAFYFCRFCVVIRFFIPATTANDLRLWRISIPDYIHYIYFPILILEKEPVFPIWMFSAKQGPRHTKDVIKMVPVVPLFDTQHWKGKILALSQELR